MNLTTRVIEAGTDFALMAALARSFSGENTHVVDLPYRFSSWALDDPHNTQLWFIGPELVAWGIIQPPFWSIDITCKPALVGRLFPAVLDWANARTSALLGTASARPAWYINTYGGQHERREALEQAGYAPQTDVGEDSWSKVLLKHTAPVALIEPVLADGVSIRPLRGDREVPAYVELHRAVFESRNMTETWRQRTLLQPAYQPEADLIALDHTGKLLGFCIGWFDPAGFDGRPGGQIEPMGVEASWRGKGIGKALLHTCIQRLYQLGAEHILVETDNYRGAALGLYETCGFHAFKDILVYRKDFPTAD